MLRVKKIGSQHMGEEKGKEKNKEPCEPTEMNEQEHSNCNMNEQRNQRIPMPAGAAEEGLYAHAVNEHGDVGKEHVERVPDRQVEKTFGTLRLRKTLQRHDGKRTDAR